MNLTVTEEVEALAVRVGTAARMLGVCDRTIERLIKAGEIKVRKLGAATLIPVSELKRWLAAGPK